VPSRKFRRPRSRGPYASCCRVSASCRRRAASVYLIRSGEELEIDHDGKRLRLPSGAMFGGDGLLGEARTEGAVTAVRFCRLLVPRTGGVRKLQGSAPP